MPTTSFTLSLWNLRHRRRLRKRGLFLFCAIVFGTYLWTTHGGNSSDGPLGSSIKLKRRREAEMNGPTNSFRNENADVVTAGSGMPRTKCESPQSHKGRRSLRSYFRPNITDDQVEYEFLNIDDGTFEGKELDYIVLQDYIVTGLCKAEAGNGARHPPDNESKPGAKEVTIFTQCSLDRSHLLIDLAAAWQGHISVALYIESPDIQLPTLDRELQDLTEKLEKAYSSTKPSHILDNTKLHGATVTISLLFGRRFSVPPCSCTGSSYTAPVSSPETNENDDGCVKSCLHHPYDFLYPINALRNLALSRTKTSLVFSLDVDFLPSTFLYSYLTTNSAFHRLLNSANSDTRTSDHPEYGSLSESKPILAFVVPSFEFTSPLTEYTVDALTRKNLHKWCVTGEVIPFHARLVKRKEFDVEKAKKWCTGATQTKFHIEMTRVQGMTNYTKWFSASEMYGIGTGIDPINDTAFGPATQSSHIDRYYEPYIIVERDSIPAYDERFRGYAFNKRAHNIQVQLVGIRFVILPNVYVVHRWHPASSSKSAVKDEHGIIKQTVNRSFEAFLRNGAARR